MATQQTYYVHDNCASEFKFSEKFTIRKIRLSLYQSSEKLLDMIHIFSSADGATAYRLLLGCEFNSCQLLVVSSGNLLCRVCSIFCLETR